MVGQNHQKKKKKSKTANTYSTVLTWRQLVVDFVSSGIAVRQGTWRDVGANVQKKEEVQEMAKESQGKIRVEFNYGQLLTLPVRQQVTGPWTFPVQCFLHFFLIFLFCRGRKKNGLEQHGDHVTQNENCQWSLTGTWSGTKTFEQKSHPLKSTPPWSLLSISVRSVFVFLVRQTLKYN